MFGIIGYRQFVLTAILLNMTPGADTIYVLSKSAAGGRKQGAASALGISTGILIHTLLASLGLSAVLARSAALFNLMKLLGAGYLIVMGLKALFSKTGPEEPGEEGRLSLRKVYCQGVWTNALNPKVALFFLALLPQFVSAGQPYGPLPFLLLGLTFCCTNTLWSLLVAFFSALAGNRLRTGKARNITAKVSGLVYIALGLSLGSANAEA